MSLDQWIERVGAATLLCPARFTLHDVCKALKLPPTEQTKASISAALQHLASPKMVTIFEKGHSHKPTVYERIPCAAEIHDAA